MLGETLMITEVDDIVCATETEAGDITGAHEEKICGARCFISSLANRSFDKPGGRSRLFKITSPNVERGLLKNCKRG